MVDNDNVRDILNWELPEVKEVGVCLDCQQLKEIEEGGFCLDCLIEIDEMCDLNANLNAKYLIQLFGEDVR